jgi:hypothetical protein
MHPEPRPDQVRVVVGDVHAAHRGLEILLREVGAIDEAGNRRGSHFVAQLGDLLHLGHTTAEADRATLECGTRWIDLQLLGNHEGFYAFSLESCFWNRMASPDQVHPEVLATLGRQAREGRWHIAATLDGWLLAHAGVHPAYQGQLGSGHPSEAAAALVRMFADRLANPRRVPVIDCPGPVRGSDPEPGGVLWCDLSEIEPVASRNGLRQMVGHTPQEAPRMVGDHIWAVDTGGGRSGKLSALVKEPGDDRWTPVSVAAPDPQVS